MNLNSPDTTGAPNAGRYMVVDVETQKGFNEVDRKKLHLLKISVACLYDSKTDSYIAFEEKELTRMEELLKQADLIVGFNIRDFDMEVLAPYFVSSVKNFPVLDILVEFEKARGHRISLQSIAQATLKMSKSGSGWDAIQLYKDGKIEELKNYCMDDVKITREIYEYGLKNGKVIFQSNRDYQNYEVPISWGNAIQTAKQQKKIENAFPTSLF
jgi:DEAD/DEAH box helicase domain-containing protein